MIASFGPMTGDMGRMAHDVEEERGSIFTALNLHIGTGERKKDGESIAFSAPDYYALRII